MAYTPPRMYDAAELARKAAACGHPREVLIDAPEILAHLDRGGRACDSCGWLEPLRHRGRFHRCPFRAPQVFGRPYSRPRRLRGYYRVWDGFDRREDGREYDREFRSLRGAARFLRRLAREGVEGASAVRYAKRRGWLATTGRWWILDGRGNVRRMGAS